MTFPAEIAELDAMDRKGLLLLWQLLFDCPAPAMLSQTFLRRFIAFELQSRRHGGLSRKVRYYVSNRLISGGRDQAGWRLPALALETAVIETITKHLQEASASHRLLARPEASSVSAIKSAVAELATQFRDTGGAVCAGLLVSGTIKRGRICLDLDGKALASALGLAADDLHPDLLRIEAPFDLRRRGVEAKIIAGDVHPQPDPHLRSMLIRAHGWVRDLKSGVQIAEIARREQVPASFIRTRAQLAFLSPRIQVAILDGSQPPELTLKRLVSVTHPIDWTEQERIFGF